MATASRPARRPRRDLGVRAVEGRPNFRNNRSVIGSFTSHTQLDEVEAPYAPGFHPVPGIRFTIRVLPGSETGERQPLILDYEGDPMVLVGRNQEAEELAPGTDEKLSDLCRPPNLP